MPQILQNLVTSQSLPMSDYLTLCPGDLPPHSLYALFVLGSASETELATGTHV